MSGLYPAIPEPQRIQLGYIQPSFVSVTHSLKRQVRSIGTHRWRWGLRYDALTYDRTPATDLHLIQAFLSLQQGRAEAFDFIAPGPYATPRGTAQGPNPWFNVSPGVMAGATQVTTINWFANQPQALAQGDFVKFAGHNKVYQASNDLVVGAGATGVLDFWPPLQTDVATNEQGDFQNVQFRMASTSDGVQYALQPPDFHSLTVELVEDL